MALAWSLCAQEPEALWNKPDRWYDSNGENLITLTDGIKMLTDPATGNPISQNDQMPYQLRSQTYNHRLRHINQTRPVNMALLGGLANDIINSQNNLELKDYVAQFTSPDQTIYGFLDKKKIFIKDSRSGKTLGELDNKDKKGWGIRDY